ncbi:MAG: PaaI family thioesterase [Actinomycetota bacterium]
MTDDLTAFVHSSMPLCAELGVRATALDPERCVLELDWRAELCTIGGVLHGGALMALADSAGAACAFANLPEGASGTSTIDSQTNLLGAVRDGTATATATPLHVGSSTIVVETEIRRSDGRLAAKTTQTQIVLR